MSRARGRRRDRGVGRVGRAVVREFARDRASHRAAGPRPGRAGSGPPRGRGGWAAGRWCCRPTWRTPAPVEAAAAAVERELGPIDVWVNNAMVSVFSPVKEMTADGVPARDRGDLPRLRPRHACRPCGACCRATAAMIVQVGSALCYRGIPLQSAYCAAKHAIQGFTESLRCELIHDGSNVKVTMVHLPATNTPQHSWSKSRMPRKAQPVPPIYQPEVGGPRHPLRRPPLPPRVEPRVGHRRRDRWGTRSCPDLGDWYLGTTWLRVANDRRAGGPGPAGQSVAALARRPWGTRPIQRSLGRLQSAVVVDQEPRLARSRWASAFWAWPFCCFGKMARSRSTREGRRP